MSSLDTVDRLAPTRRPQGTAVMKQTWSELLFLHWPVPVAALRPLVPTALEIDTFGGQAWVGLVPFTVSGARLRVLPALPPVSRFHEVNVRTYVHLQGRDPGVWFFSLDAASRMAVRLARLLYKLPYRFARIALEREEPADGRARRIRFTSCRAAAGAPGVEVHYGGAGSPRPAVPGSLEHFLAERYVLYTCAGPAVYRARVHHAPYPLQPGVVEHWRESLIAAAGMERPDGEPLAHYASGVDVDIWPLEALT